MQKRQKESLRIFDQVIRDAMIIAFVASFSDRLSFVHLKLILLSQHS